MSNAKKAPTRSENIPISLPVNRDNRYGRGIDKDLKLSQALLADRAKERKAARRDFRAARSPRGKK